MNKRLLLTMILTILLVACGQSVNQNDTTTTNKDEEDSKSTSVVEEQPTDEPVDKSEKNIDEMDKDESEPAKDNTKSTPLSELKVHYIDAGQADATLFQFSDENDSYTILYDTGDWNKNDVVNYLDAQDITFLDLIIVSHPHADHIGQMAEVVHTYDVGEVWMSGNETSSQTFQRAIEAVLESDADYHEPKTGEEFDLGPLKIDVLHPDNLTGGLNEDSISLLFTYGETKFIFTGDASKKQERQMIHSGVDMDATILRLGHHGSKTSTDPAFLDAVNPEVAIYSAGTGNSYGHPHPDVVSRVQEANIDLYGTDVHGTIIVTTDGETYDILTNKEGTVSRKHTDSARNEQQKKDPEEPIKEKANNKDCVDINTASLEEVQEIIHIGPARAKDLMDQRPYNSVHDLTSINGIGPARIDDIKNQNKACVGG